jgi:pyridoxal phosphate enzyme (YggS family)
VTPSDLQTRFENITDRIAKAAHRVGRKDSEVELLPVSKGHSVGIMKKALALKNFPKAFGENYLEELLEKQKVLGRDEIKWHFIGRAQSRKIGDISAAVSVFQSLSRKKEIKLVTNPISVFIQVNVSKEKQKNGCDENELAELIDLAWREQLKVKGLMCLPSDALHSSEKIVRDEFTKLRELRDKFLPKGLLSMGMSNDFDWAIEEGSNLVRIGSALFGERAKN